MGVSGNEAVATQRRGGSLWHLTAAARPWEKQCFLAFGFICVCPPDLINGRAVSTHFSLS